MQEQWSEFFADPNMRLMWGIAGAVAMLGVLAYRFGSKRENTGPAIRKIVQAVTGIASPQPKLVIWPTVVGISSMLCFFAGMMLNTVSILHRQGQSILGWFLIAIFLLSTLLIRSARTYGLLWIHRRLLRADYEGALARADALLAWFPESPTFHHLRGATLLFAGRLPEAEQAIRTSLEKGQSRPGFAQATHLGNLGAVLLALGRFKEATAAYEGAAKIYPQYSSAQNGLAEVWLRQGLEPQRALLLVDTALQLKQRDARRRNADRHMLAHMSANRAQALAMMRQMDEAASAVATAQNLGDPAFIPGLAGTYWRCGVALRLMGKENAAIEQFRKATEIDPHGLYGKLAVSAMQEQEYSLPR